MEHEVSLLSVLQLLIRLRLQRNKLFIPRSSERPSSLENRKEQDNNLNFAQNDTTNNGFPEKLSLNLSCIESVEEAKSLHKTGITPTNFCYLNLSYSDFISHITFSRFLKLRSELNNFL